MKTNILQAINSLIEDDLYSLERYKTLSYKIRINNTGEALENLIKDALCNNYNLEADKKIESNEGSIALNRSFPKDKLYKNSNMITVSCKNCEADWIEKDICYIIGCIDKAEKIKSLWFIYGDCYCAKPEVYTRIKDKITNSVQELGIELSTTN